MVVITCYVPEEHLGGPHEILSLCQLQQKIAKRMSVATSVDIMVHMNVKPSPLDLLLIQTSKLP